MIAKRPIDKNPDTPLTNKAGKRPKLLAARYSAKARSLAEERGSQEIISAPRDMVTNPPGRTPVTGAGTSHVAQLGFSPDRIFSRLPKTSQVYELIRQAIITMKLRPGEPIVEMEICEALGVSRTPLREAILQLAAESLVVVKPGGGTFVNVIMIDEVLDGQILRDTLEKRLVQLAARHYEPSFARPFEALLFQQKLAADQDDMDGFFDLDNQFHKLICECSRFPNGWRSLHHANGQLDRIRRYALPQSQHYFESLEQHRDIYRCIQKRDEAAAAEAFQTHIDQLFREIDLINQFDPLLVSQTAQLTTACIR